MQLSELGTDLVCAWGEHQLRTQELFPQLASELRLSVYEVFYQSRWGRLADYSGVFLGGEWTYSFHTSRCQIKHRCDGRSLRIEFGPGGRFDCVLACSIHQFVRSTKPPWRVFPRLTMAMDEDRALGRPEHGIGSLIVRLYERLEAGGIFECAAPDLPEPPDDPAGGAVAVGTDGLPPREQLDWDLRWCHVLSAAGWEIVRASCRTGP